MRGGRDYQALPLAAIGNRRYAGGSGLPWGEVRAMPIWLFCVLVALPVWRSAAGGLEVMGGRVTSVR